MSSKESTFKIQTIGKYSSLEIIENEENCKSQVVKLVHSRPKKLDCKVKN